MKTNYYDYLCAKMYVILPIKAQKDKLKFYLSYVNKKDKIFRVNVWKWAVLIKIAKDDKTKYFCSNVLNKG